MKNIVNKPSTIEDYFKDVKFQCESIESYLSVNDLFSAGIKAKCLIKAANDLLSKIKEEDPDTKKRRPIF